MTVFAMGNSFELILKLAFSAASGLKLKRILFSSTQKPIIPRESLGLTVSKCVQPQKAETSESEPNPSKSCTDILRMHGHNSAMLAVHLRNQSGSS